MDSITNEIRVLVVGEDSAGLPVRVVEAEVIRYSREVGYPIRRRVFHVEATNGSRHNYLNPRAAISYFHSITGVGEAE